jgi:uncharacterized protein YjlB
LILTARPAEVSSRPRLKTGAESIQISWRNPVRAEFFALPAHRPFGYPPRHPLAVYARPGLLWRSRYVGGVMEEQPGTYRRQFLARSFKMTALLALGSISTIRRVLAQARNMKQPETALFKDDGVIPNNRLHLLLYRGVLPIGEADPASRVVQLFAANNWTNSWRNGIYPFHHYHSTSHEVLGVYRGSVTVRLGGEQGKDFEVRAGDVIVIPAGVGHKNLGASEDFGVVGAYPDGRDWDLLTGKPGERPRADKNIASLPVPDNDPVFGAEGPLRGIWGA